MTATDSVQFGDGPDIQDVPPPVAVPSSVRKTPRDMYEVYVGGTLVAVASTPEEAEEAREAAVAWWWSRRGVR